MRELTTWRDVAAATGSDTLAGWAAGTLGAGGRAWTDGAATAVAAPWLSERDRLVVHGEPAAAAGLVRHVFAELGRTYRPLGDAELIGEIVARVPGLEPPKAFGWMTAHDDRAPGLGASDAYWLPDAELAEAAVLIERVFPDSHAQPGRDGVRRWAGVRDATGRLAAVAADAWSAPSVGLLAGVTTAPHARGRGLATGVCAFLCRTLIAEHGRVALMVDDWNHAAIRLYERLGLRWRSVAATRDAAAHEAPSDG